MKELGYVKEPIDSMWYNIGGKSLNASLNQLIDDDGAAEMKLLKCFRKVQLYVIHIVSEPTLMNDEHLLGSNGAV